MATRWTAGTALALVVAFTRSLPERAQALDPGASRYIGPEVVQCTSEEEAVRLLRHLGAAITRDDTLPGKPVVAAALAYTKVTDTDLARLRGLRALRYLDLSRTRITNAGLLHLKELRTLRFVRVGGTNTSKAGEDKLKRAQPKLDVCNQTSPCLLQFDRDGGFLRPPAVFEP